MTPPTQLTLFMVGVFGLGERPTVDNGNTVQETTSRVGNQFWCQVIGTHDGIAGATLTITGGALGFERYALETDEDGFAVVEMPVGTPPYARVDAKGYVTALVGCRGGHETKDKARVILLDSAAELRAVLPQADLQSQGEPTLVVSADPTKLARVAFGL